MFSLLRFCWLSILIPSFFSCRSVEKRQASQRVSAPEQVLPAGLVVSYRDMSFDGKAGKFKVEAERTSFALFSDPNGRKEPKFDHALSQDLEQKLASSFVPADVVNDGTVFLKNQKQSLAEGCYPYVYDPNLKGLFISTKQQEVDELLRAYSGAGKTFPFPMIQAAGKLCVDGGSQFLSMDTQSRFSRPYHSMLAFLSYLSQRGLSPTLKMEEAVQLGLNGQQRPSTAPTVRRENGTVTEWRTHANDDHISRNRYKVKIPLPIGPRDSQLASSGRSVPGSEVDFERGGEVEIGGDAVASASQGRQNGGGGSTGLQEGGEENAEVRRVPRRRRGSERAGKRESLGVDVIPRGETPQGIRPKDLSYKLEGLNSWDELMSKPLNLLRIFNHETFFDSSYGYFFENNRTVKLQFLKEGGAPFILNLTKEEGGPDGVTNLRLSDPNYPDAYIDLQVRSGQVASRASDLIESTGNGPSEVISLRRMRLEQCLPLLSDGDRVQILRTVIKQLDAGTWTGSLKVEDLRIDREGDLWKIGTTVKASSELSLPRESELANLVFALALKNEHADMAFIAHQDPTSFSKTSFKHFIDAASKLREAVNRMYKPTETRPLAERQQQRQEEAKNAIDELKKAELLEGTKEKEETFDGTEEEVETFDGGLLGVRRVPKRTRKVME